MTLNILRYLTNTLRIFGTAQITHAHQLILFYDRGHQVGNGYRSYIFSSKDFLLKVIFRFESLTEVLNNLVRFQED